MIFRVYHFSSGHILDSSEVRKVFIHYVLIFKHHKNAQNFITLIYFHIEKRDISFKKWYLGTYMKN